MRAADVLASIGRTNKGAVPILPLTKADQNIEVRQRAVIALAVSSPEAVAVLIEVMKGDRDDLRIEAIKAVEQHGEQGKPAVPVLLDLLKASDFAIRLEAIRGLGSMGPAAADAVSALNMMLEGNSNPIEASIICGAGKNQRKR